MKAVLLESLGISKSRLEELEAPFLAKGWEFIHYEKTADISLLQNEIRDADALILANMPLPEKALYTADHLKYIDVAFTGVDHIPLAYCKEHNISVSNASGYSNEAVAELVIGMVLSKLRNLRQVEDRCRSGSTKDGLIGSEIKGKTVGIIGYGAIGSRSGELFHAFGADILTLEGHRIKGNPDFVKAVDMDTLLSCSDIVVLHCPLNDSTRGLIGKEELAKMKDSALLVNAARGPVVNSEDLAEALHTGTIAGACIDVFDKEPPLSTEEPLLKAPHTVVTPHVAFATEESMSLRADIVFENLRAFDRGEILNKVL